MFIATALAFVFIAAGSASGTSVLDGIIQTQPNDDDLLTQWQQWTAALPSHWMPINASSATSFDGVFHNVSLIQILFDGDRTRMEQQLHVEFEEMDVNDDGNVTLAEVKQHYRDVYGPLRFTFMQMSGKWRHQFDQMDTNEDQVQTWQEFHDGSVQAMEMQVPLPNALQSICDTLASRLDAHCGLQNPLWSEALQSAMVRQRHLCQSGLSWLKSQMKTEQCLLQRLEDADFCQHKVPQCMQEAVGQLEKDSGIATNTNGTVALNKRMLGQIFGAGLTTIWITTPLLIGLVATLVAFGLLVAFAIAPSVASKHQVRKYWNANQQFERWAPGLPLPPCGTPILFWNNQCGPLMANRTRTCHRGVLLHEKSCKWWWSYGSRTCGFGGCQALCADVVTENCPAGFVPSMKIAYGSTGFAAPVKALDMGP
jgi:hypothetical protein